MTLDEAIEIIKQYQKEFEIEQGKFKDIPDNFDFRTWLMIIRKWHWLKESGE